MCDGRLVARERPRGPAQVEPPQQIEPAADHDEQSDEDGPTLQAPHGALLQAAFLKLSGTIPPFWASLAITAFCSAMFSSADPAAPAFTPSSCASCLRASRLESSPSSFSRSTMEVRQFPPPPAASSAIY